MRKLIKILDVNIDRLNLEQSVERVKELTADRSQPSLVVTPNSEMLALAADDSELAGILNSADLATADGIGVVIASKILGKPLAERVAGFDLISALFE
ncbi:MAG: WecB/TagA/CpsF family glycosyltransferase, partial [Halanaerobium sp.]